MVRDLVEDQNVRRFMGTQLVEEEIQALKQLENEMSNPVFLSINIGNKLDVVIKKDIKSKIPFLKVITFKVEGNHVTDLYMKNIWADKIPKCILKFKEIKSISLIHFSKLKSFPQVICYLKKLEILYLEKCSINDIPEEIGELSKLKKIVFKNCYKFSEIPTSFANLKELYEFKSLNTLSNNEQFEQILKCKNISELSIIGSKIESIPKSLFNLLKLRYLNLSYSKISTLPSAIRRLTNLEELILNNTNLKNIPVGIGNCTNLRLLKLDYNKIISVPESLLKLKNLEETPTIKKLKQQITGEKKLETKQEEKKSEEKSEKSTDTKVGLYIKKLVYKDEILVLEELDKMCGDKISFFKIENYHVTMLSLMRKNYNATPQSSLPESIGKLVELKYLNFSKTTFSTLPDSIGNLKKLEEFKFSESHIEELPEEICLCKEIMIMEAEEGKLTKLPQNIGNLTKLTSLILSKNEINALPESIGKLKNLETFRIDKNRLTNLPKSFANLIRLKECNLEGNTIENIPGGFEHFSQLESLLLIGNNIKFISRKIEDFEQLKKIEIDYLQLRDITALLRKDADAQQILTNIDQIAPIYKDLLLIDKLHQSKTLVKANFRKIDILDNQQLFEPLLRKVEEIANDVEEFRRIDISDIKEEDKVLISSLSEER